MQPRSKYNDLTGQRFDRWLVIDRAYHSKGHGSMWNCRCDCGNSSIVSLSNLRSGASKSCGCILRERGDAGRAAREAKGYTGRRSPTAQTWDRMKSRCLLPTNPRYDDYGGRGIKVCDRWLGDDGLANLIADMGERPGPAYSLDRFPDTNGDYEPGNCRWATPKQQASNKRCNTLFTYCGETKTITQWARENGITQSALRYRLIVKKMPFAIAVTKPLGKRRVKVTYRGKQLTLRQLEGLCGVDQGTLLNRISRGWDVEKAANTPVRNQARFITCRGVTKTLTEWSDLTGLHIATLANRLNKGWNAEVALTTSTNPGVNLDLDHLLTRTGS